MIKKTAVILFALCCLIVFSYYLKPSVSVYNNSGDVVYLYKGTGEKNVEPDIEQAGSSMRPILISNAEHEKVILSWQDLNLNNGQLYLGWSTKNHESSSAIVSGGRVFDITSGNGYCSYNVYVGHESEMIEPWKGIVCFKKINISSEK